MSTSFGGKCPPPLKLYGCTVLKFGQQRLDGNTSAVDAGLVTGEAATHTSWFDPDSSRGRALGGVVVAAVAAWGVARTALVGITHDEALTLLLHVPGSWSDIFAHRLYIGSNNHLLTTLLLKLVARVLPPAEWAIRLPAVLGLGLYLAGCWRLLRRTVSGPRFALGLALLAANPFVLDLLTLARGYGLGLGLLTIAASSMRATAHASRLWRAHAVAAGLATLAVTANVSLAFGALALGLVAVGAAICQARPWHKERQLSVLAAAAMPWLVGLLISVAIFRPSVLRNISLYVAEWGGERGFWADTVTSLAAASLYQPQWQVAAPALVVLFGGVLAGGTVLAAATWGRKSWESLGPPVAFSWLVAAAMAVAHLAAGMRWPVDRAAVVLLPAFSLVLVGLGEVLASFDTALAGKATRVVCAIAGLLVGVWVASWNLRQTYLWRVDAATPEVMRRIAAAAAGLPSASVRLAVSWRLEPAVNFYRLSRKLEALAPVRREAVGPGADFYYLEGQQRAAVSLLGLTLCVEFPSAGTLLAVPPGRQCP